MASRTSNARSCGPSAPTGSMTIPRGCCGWGGGGGGGGSGGGEGPRVRSSHGAPPGGGPGAEPAGDREVREKLPDVAGRHGHAGGAAGAVPVCVDGEADGQGKAGADQGDGDAEGGAGPVAKAGSAVEEAGVVSARGADQEGLAGVRDHVYGGAGRDPVPALPLDRKSVV